MMDKDFGGRSFRSGMERRIVAPGSLDERGQSQSSGQAQNQADNDARFADVQEAYDQLKIETEQGE
jgi:hypothetical protein